MSKIAELKNLMIEGSVYNPAELQSYIEIVTKKRDAAKTDKEKVAFQKLIDTAEAKLKSYSKKESLDEEEDTLEDVRRKVDNLAGVHGQDLAKLLRNHKDIIGANAGILVKEYVYRVNDIVSTSVRI